MENGLLASISDLSYILKKNYPQLNDVRTSNSTAEDLCQTEMHVYEGHTDYSDEYKGIIEYCRVNRQNFLDDSFPHSARSIGSLFQLEKKNLNIVWFRPQHISTRDGKLARWSVFNDPQPADIEQGLLGNCWFLSAMAVVSERPDILEQLFLTKQYNHSGVYEMRLCIDGLWTNVFVDDYFPCHKRSRTMVFAVGRKNQLWVSLLEKALAKIYGNYAMLRAGRTVEGLSTLTGAPTLSIDLEHTELDTHSRQMALDVVWAQLLSARETRFIMGCSCGGGKRHVDETEYTKMGLMTQHAYSILDVKQTSKGYRLIHLRNPWGTFSWLGEFGQFWPGWTRELFQELNSEGNPMPGTFWMPFERFVHFFDTVDIAQIRTNWFSTRYLLNIGWAEDKTKIVRFTITEPTELCVILHQRNARTTLDQSDILILVHKQDPTRDSYPAELVCRSPRKIQPLVRTEDTFFLPGEYLICVHSFSKFADQAIAGALVIYSSKKVFSELFSASLDVLQASICSFILKESVNDVHDRFAGSIVRYLTHDFSGLALMIDNVQPNYCIQVYSDCQNSSNVLSTRASLLAVDSIPPLHRQIITILTHFEPTQSFTVGHRLVQRQTPFPQLRDYAPSPELATAQNYPPLVGLAVGSLHAPIPLFD